MQTQAVFMDWRLKMVKVSVLPNAICKFNAITIKITETSGFFSEIDKFILKFKWNLKRPSTKAILVLLFLISKLNTRL